MTPPCRTVRPTGGSQVIVPVAWFTTVYAPESASVPDSELCEVSVCRVTAAIEVRYAVPAAPGPGEPEPWNAPTAAATPTPASTTTITTPTTTQRRAPRRRFTSGPAWRSEEMVPLILHRQSAGGAGRGRRCSSHGPPVCDGCWAVPCTILGRPPQGAARIACEFGVSARPPAGPARSPPFTPNSHASLK